MQLVTPKYIILAKASINVTMYITDTKGCIIANSFGVVITKKAHPIEANISTTIKIILIYNFLLNFLIKNLVKIKLKSAKRNHKTYTKINIKA